MKTIEQPSPSAIIEEAFNNIKTKKQMKKQEIIERIETLENLVKNMLQSKDIIIGYDEPKQKLIMSIDEIDFNWWDENINMAVVFGKLKIIEKQWNDGKAFDWEYRSTKHAIELLDNKWDYDTYWRTVKHFHFHTKHHAQLFLTTFEKELEVIKPLFS